jgi:hypothetical protein
MLVVKKDDVAIMEIVSVNNTGVYNLINQTVKRHYLRHWMNR